MWERVREWGRNALGYATHLELFSDRKLYIENCKKVQEYNDIRIVVQTGEFTIEVWGARLRTDIRTAEGILIHGQIRTITLTPKGKAYGKSHPKNV